jgi:hypothetical protein
MFGQSAVLSHDSPPMEVVRKAIRTVTGRNARGEVVEAQREVEEAIIDDHLPAGSVVIAGIRLIYCNLLYF